VSDRIYYRVHLDSPVVAVIQAAEVKEKVFAAACNEIREQFPGGIVWTSTSFWKRVEGIQFPGDPPPGWIVRKSRDGHYFARPGKRTAEGRAAAKWLAELPHGVCAASFSDMMTAVIKAEYTHRDDDCRISWTVFEKHGDVYILSVPAACEAKPPGCTELLMSEYYRIREAAEGAKKPATVSQEV
jgi:hypothetical protein